MLFRHLYLAPSSPVTPPGVHSGEQCNQGFLCWPHVHLLRGPDPAARFPLRLDTETASFGRRRQPATAPGDPTGKCPKTCAQVEPISVPDRRFPDAQNDGGHVVGDDAIIGVISASGSLVLGASRLSLAPRASGQRAAPAM